MKINIEIADLSNEIMLDITDNRLNEGPRVGLEPFKIF